MRTIPAAENRGDKYAWAHIEHNQEYAKNKVDEQALTVEKYLDLFALTVYMNVVKVPCLADCASTACLFVHGMSQLFQTLSPKFAT